MNNVPDYNDKIHHSQERNSPANKALLKFADHLKIGQEVFLCYGPEDFFNAYLDFADEDEAFLIKTALSMRQRGRNIVYDN